MKSMKKTLSLLVLSFFTFSMNAQEGGSKLVKKLDSYVKEVVLEFDQIDSSRQAALKELAGLIAEGNGGKLTFICTHNSRRSQMAQAWAAVAAYYYGIENIETYSGGTEATAFNPRAVKALKRAGFNVKSKGNKNPLYRVYYTGDREPLRCFSKTYQDRRNPQKDFIAVMVCSDADEACPLVDGAKARLAIPYVDPKVSDGTFMEKDIYNARCRQIAREMLFVMASVK